MTVSDLRRDERTAYLESLLPAHVLQRDAESGGLLHALLSAVATELATVEDDLQSLYDSWFVETAPEWVLPYLADLVGLDGLPGDLGSGTGAGVSRRGVVANTVSYRQRKGTVAVIEQVVRDVTGWPTKAVETYRLLGTTTHVNHVRPERPTWASLRDAASAELGSPRLAQGALTRFAHTAHVRRVDPGRHGGRGRYGIENIAVFVFPVQVYEAVDVAARALGDPEDGWATHPLGVREPWFAVPATETTIEHLADESDLPVPLRPRRLLALLRAARARGVDTDPPTLPVAVRIDGADPLEPWRLRVRGLEELATDDAGTPDDPSDDPPLGWQVTVDPVCGRVRTYLDGVATNPGSVLVRYAYGAVADVGAGTYDRSPGHAKALAADPFTGDTDEGGDRIESQVLVRTGPPAGGLRTTVVDGLTDIAARWAATDPDLTGGTQVLSVADSETYTGTLDVDVPAESRLVLVAATWRGRLLLNGDVEAPVPGVYSPDGLRPRILGDVVVTGAAGSAVLLDGLVVDGDVVVQAGDLRSLTLSQCSIAGRVVVEGTVDDGNRELAVAVRRSLVGGIDLVGTVPTLSVVDAVRHARRADPRRDVKPVHRRRHRRRPAARLRTVQLPGSRLAHTAPVPVRAAPRRRRRRLAVVPRRRARCHEPRLTHLPSAVPRRASVGAPRRRGRRRDGRPPPPAPPPEGGRSTSSRRALRAGGDADRTVRELTCTLTSPAVPSTPRWGSGPSSCSKAASCSTPSGTSRPTSPPTTTRCAPPTSSGRREASTPATARPDPSPSCR